MWVEQTNKGLRLCDRYIGLDGKTHKASVSLLRDTAQARRKAQEELQEKISSISSTKSEMPLKSLVALYLKNIDVKPSTLENYSNALNQVSSHLGDITINRLTASYVLRKLSEGGKATTTINRYINIFNLMMTWAHDYGYIPEPLNVHKLKVKERKKDTSGEYLEASELAEVLDQLSGMPYYISKFLALTGCRIGEAGALTLSDVDDRYIHITKAYKYSNGVSTPKTPSSVRDIYIQPELRKFLNEYKRWRLIHMTAYGIRTDLLFFNLRGSFYTQQVLLQALRKVKCEKHLHPHIFRHTHTALLAEQGLSLEVIARRLGHTSSDITKQIYFHVTEKLKQRDEEALNHVSIL